MSPFRLAFLSLVRKKVSTLIALTSIALSVACGGLLLRLYLLSSSRFETLPTEYDSVVGAKSSGIDILLNSLHSEGEYPGFIPYKLFLTLKSGQTIGFEDNESSQASFIKEIIPIVYFGILDKFRLVGTDPEIMQASDLHFSDGVWPTTLDQVSVGANVASSLRLKVGDSIEVAPWVGDFHPSGHLAFSISGIIARSNKNWDNQIYTSVDAAHRFFAQDIESMKTRSIWGPQVLNYFLIKTQINGFIPLENLINKRSVAQVIGVDREVERLRAMIGIGKYLGVLVSVFVIILGGLSVAGVIITRFDSMTAQLAVMRAIGFGKRQITQWLLWEGFLLGMTGCFLGGLLDFIFFPVLRSLLEEALPANQWTNIYIFQSFPVWAGAGIATLVAVFIPIYRAFRQDIHDSLRGF